MEIKRKKNVKITSFNNIKKIQQKVKNNYIHAIPLVIFLSSDKRALKFAVEKHVFNQGDLFRNEELLIFLVVASPRKHSLHSCANIARLSNI